jgi:hypothetical protein
MASLSRETSEYPQPKKFVTLGAFPDIHRFSSDATAYFAMYVPDIQTEQLTTKATVVRIYNNNDKEASICY